MYVTAGCNWLACPSRSVELTNVIYGTAVGSVWVQTFLPSLGKVTSAMCERGGPLDNLIC